MNKLPVPARFTRTTIAELDNLPNAGVYIIAYLGCVLYVGKSGCDVCGRLRLHLTKPSQLGAWLRRVEDWGNVRLDVLEAPFSDDFQVWLTKAEDALIHRFKPLFNMQLMA